VRARGAADDGAAVGGVVFGGEARMLRPDVLRRKKDFDRLYRKGIRIHGKYIVVIFAKNDMGFNRTAFLASRKVGKAVQRNRARRLMKEAFRGLSAELVQGYDVLFIARSTILDAKCPEVKKTMTTAFIKGKLFR
jgi:ribonuclease P protein component